MDIPKLILSAMAVHLRLLIEKAKLTPNTGEDGLSIDVYVGGVAVILLIALQEKTMNKATGIKKRFK